MTPSQFIVDYQPRWEGGLSVDPNDAGNWSTGVKGQGVLVGSNHGVTPRVLSAYRGGKPVTMADMKALTAKEAGDIALKMFYYEPGLDRLPWNRVTASVMDFGYNAGPGRAVRILQDLIDAPTIDGIISPGGSTQKLYTQAIQTKGEAFMAGAWWAMREEYYEDLVKAKPSNGIYLKGWDNRSDYFTPGHKEGWWNRFG